MKNDEMDDHSELKETDLLRHLMDASADHIYFKDKNSRFLQVNRSQAAWMGLEDPAEAMGKTDFDFFAAEHAQQAREDEERIMSSREPVVGKEEKETWPDGRVTWVSTSKMPLIGRNGTVVGTFGVSRDITAHKRAEAKAVRYAWRLREMNRQIRKDLAMARQLQEAFLPQRYPIFKVGPAATNKALEFRHHYHAVGLVGGDFFSIVPLSRHEAGIFLCDVMGHGVQAALVTAIIRTILGEWAPVERDPAALLEKMNELLVPTLGRDEFLVFASACYLVLDVRSGVLRFASAGHPSPLWARGGGEEVTFLLEKNKKSRGPALALVDNPEYATVEHDISPGDRFLLFTDGVFEAVNAGDEEFGLERLRQTLGGLRHSEMGLLLGGIHEEVIRFAGGDGFDDDVCMIAVEVLETGRGVAHDDA